MRRIFNKVLTIGLICAMVFTFISFTSLAVEMDEATEDVPTTVEVEAEELALPAPETTEENPTTVEGVAEQSAPPEVVTEAEDRIIMDLSVVAPAPTPQSIVVSWTWIQAPLNGGISSVYGFVGVYVSGDVLRIPASSDLVTITGLDTSQLGAQSVNVSVFGLSATVDAWVFEPMESPIPSENEPQSMMIGWTGMIFQGQTPEFVIRLFDGPFGYRPEDGFVFHTGDYIRTVISTPDMISGFNPNQVGEQTVTITYQDVTVTTTVYVYPPIPGESWEFSRLGTPGIEGWITPPLRTILQGGNIRDLNMGMIFMYSGEGGFPWAPEIPFLVCESTEGMTITGVDTSLVGQQDMTITFGGVTQTVRIIVVANPNLADYYCEYCEGEGCEVCEETNGGNGNGTGNGNNDGNGTDTGNGNNDENGTDTENGNINGNGIDPEGETETPDNETNNNDTTSPRTGDGLTLLPFIAATLLSLSAIFGVAGKRRKMKN